MNGQKSGKFYPDMPQAEGENFTMHVPVWKQILLQAYYHGTVLPRRMWNARWERLGQAPIVMVYYHRVADDNANCWTISNKLFANQMAFLQRHFDLISMEEAQRRIRAGRNDRLAMHVTFDDGYGENCEHALPLLLREKIPFTYFLTSGNIFSRQPFSHDAKYNCHLPINTKDEIRALVDAGVEIGAHTRSHCNVGNIHDPQTLYSEIVESRDELEAEFKTRVRYFAFPFGLHEHLNAAAFKLGKEHGFEGFCSAYGGYNFPGDDAFHLQRFDGSPVNVQFRNWVMFDPFKHLRVRRFEYQDRDEQPIASLVAATAADSSSENGL